MPETSSFKKINKSGQCIHFYVAGEINHAVPIMFLIISIVSYLKSFILL